MSLGGGAPNIKLATLFYEVETRTKGVEQDLKETQRSLGNLSSFIEANPKAAFAGLGLAAVGAGAMIMGAATKLAAQFQSEMAKVNTVAQLSQTELQALGNDVQAAFRELPVENTQQLTDALYQVVSSGVAVGDAMDVVKVATKAAVGGFTDAETAVDAITSVMNAYRDSNMTAAHAGDVLAKAVELGKIEMNEIAGSIGNVVGVASVMGVSIEEVTAIAADLSLKGIAAGEGITAIRAAINDILRPTDLFKKEFPELAANFTETRLRGDGLVKFLQDFIRESDGSSEALKRAFNSIEGYKLAVTAAKDGGQGFADMLVKMQGAAGAIDGQFEQVNITAAAQYQIIKNNLSSAFTELGNTVLPAVNAVLGALVTTLNSFNGAAAKARAKNDAVVLATDTIAAYTGVEAAFWKARKGMLNFIEKVEDGKVSIKDLDTGVLPGLQARLTALRDSGQLSAKDLGRIGTVLAQVTQEQSARTLGAQAQERTARETTAKKAAEIEKQKAEQAKKRAGQEAEAAAEAGKAERAEADKTYKALTEKMEEYRKKRLAVQEQLEDALVDSTRTAVDDMQLQLQRAIKKLESMGATADEVGRFRVLREGAIRATENVERVAEAMQKFGRTANDVKQLEAAIMRVNSELATQIGIRNRPGITDAERVAAERNIEQLTRTRTDLEGRVADAKGKAALAAQQGADADGRSARASGEALRNVINKANALQLAAVGAVKLAREFGLVSDSAAKTLQDVIEIGTQVVTLATASANLLEAAGKGAASGGMVAAVVNAALSLGGTVAAIIGNDAKERKERARVMDSNTRAVQMLTKVQGDLLKLQVSGRDYGNSSRALQAFLGRFSNLGDFREFGKKYLEGVDPKRELEALGISFDDIKEIAKTLGITLDGQIGSYRRLLEAMRAADLSGFTSTFAGALEELDTQFEINAEKFPTAQAKLQALLALLADPLKGSAELFGELDDFDLSSADGVAKALAKVQELFDKMRTGALSADDLGNLTLADLKDIIGRLNSELRALAETPADAGPTPPTDRPPTESPGDGAPDVTPQQVTVVESMATQIERLVEATNAQSIAALTQYVAGVLAFNEAVADGLELLGPTGDGSAGLAAPSAGVRAVSQSQQLVDVPVLPRDLVERLQGEQRRVVEVHLHLSGVVVGDMESLAARLAALAATQIDLTLGRQYDRELIATGNRRIVID